MDGYESKLQVGFSKTNTFILLHSRPAIINGNICYELINNHRAETTETSYSV